MVLGQVTIAVEHTFEAAHRLPFLGGKCTNVHGHTWRVKAHLQAYKLEGGVDENGISIDFSSAKKVIRQWIDMYLDHGMMIGEDDGLIDDLWNDQCKLFVFGETDKYTETDLGDGYYRPKPWPTVESVAEAIGVKLQAQFDDVWIVAIELWEGNVNSATWTQAFPQKEETNG